MNELSCITYRRVYLVDEPIVCLGVKALLGGMLRHADVCGMSFEFRPALDKIGKLRPELVIAEIVLNGEIGIEWLKQLITLNPELPVLILSSEQESVYAVRSLQAGAIGFIPKKSSYGDLVTGIDRALKGEYPVVSSAISRSVVSSIIGNRRGLENARTDPLLRLSDRELEVFNHIGAGLTTRKIAEKLCLSVKTIETHKTHIKEKLFLKNCTELVQYAFVSNKRTSTETQGTQVQ